MIVDNLFFQTYTSLFMYGIIHSMNLNHYLQIRTCIRTFFLTKTWKYFYLPIKTNHFGLIEVVENLSSLGAMRFWIYQNKWLHKPLYLETLQQTYRKMDIIQIITKNIQYSGPYCTRVFKIHILLEWCLVAVGWRKRGPLLITPICVIHYLKTPLHFTMANASK